MYKEQGNQVNNGLELTAAGNVWQGLKMCIRDRVQAGHGRFDLRHQFKGFPAITEFYFGAVGIKAVSYTHLAITLTRDIRLINNFTGNCIIKFPVSELTGEG